MLQAQREKNKGFGLLEVVISVGILGLVVFSLSQVVSTAYVLADKSGDRVEAGYIIQEGIEALHVLRDTSWSSKISTLTPGTTYYLTFATSTNTYALTSTAQPVINGLYTRKIVMSNVNRDAQDNIASSGTNDTGTKKFRVTVDWANRGNYSESVDMYLTDLYQN